MRKLIGVLLAIGLLAVGTPAMAQTADPLGLIASGAVIPYVGNGSIAPNSMSFIELSSPVGDNSGLLSGGVGGTHMFFFDKSCVKGPASVGIPLTTNDFIIQRVDNIDSNAVEGLITIGGVDQSGFFLEPLAAPIHARMFWFNVTKNTVRILEPIGLANFEDPCSQGRCPGPNGGLQTWNPLRSGATFVAPVEGTGPGQGTNQTTIYFVCPTPSITDPKKGVFPTSDGFPELLPHEPDTAGLLVRVYGDDERFLRNGTTDCSCLSARPVTSFNGAGDVYSSLAEAPFGTLTEVEGVASKVTTPAVCGDVCPDTATDGCSLATASAADLKTCTIGGIQHIVLAPSTSTETQVSFTGYRGILGNGGDHDTFGRLSNANASSLQGPFGPPEPLGFNPGR